MPSSRTCVEGTTSSGWMHVPDSPLPRRPTSLRWWSEGPTSPRPASSRPTIDQCNSASEPRISTELVTTRHVIHQRNSAAPRHCPGVRCRRNGGDGGLPASESTHHQAVTGKVGGEMRPHLARRHVSGRCRQPSQQSGASASTDRTKPTSNPGRIRSPKPGLSAQDEAGVRHKSIPPSTA